MNGLRRSKWLLCRVLVWLVLVLPFSAVVPVTWAQQAPPLNNYSEQPGSISPEQAAHTARRESGGRVLSVTPVGKGGQRGYNVRVLIDGKRVKQYYVDSEGRISSR